MSETDYTSDSHMKLTETLNNGASPEHTKQLLDEIRRLRAENRRLKLTCDQCGKQFYCEDNICEECFNADKDL